MLTVKRERKWVRSRQAKEDRSGHKCLLVLMVPEVVVVTLVVRPVDPHVLQELVLAVLLEHSGDRVNLSRGVAVPSSTKARRAREHTSACDLNSTRRRSKPSRDEVRTCFSEKAQQKGSEQNKTEVSELRPHAQSKEGGVKLAPGSSQNIRLARARE